MRIAVTNSGVIYLYVEADSTEINSLGHNALVEDPIKNYICWFEHQTCAFLRSPYEIVIKRGSQKFKASIISTLKPIYVNHDCEQALANL